MKSPSAKTVHSAGDRNIQPGSLVHGDGSTTFVATARWIAHQQGSSCSHPQAEPVILSTGELVACVCIGCYQQLPAEYIEQQVEQAQRKAYCTHAETMEIVDFGRSPAGSRYSCAECGSWVSGTWPTLH